MANIQDLFWKYFSIKEMEEGSNVMAHPLLSIPSVICEQQLLLYK